jgi:alkanesulfonate monooxygenase SsuD/methylene tetrahydromethanopterin reductase-like flavin-dependent oxidoreductase (luciferase family)
VAGEPCVVKLRSLALSVATGWDGVSRPEERAMRFNVMLEPQEGITYAEQLAVARRAEQLGFEGMYRSDHYSSVGGRAAVGSPDAWAAIAGLARGTDRIRLGTLVSPVTFRLAGNLAKVVATVAEMAGVVPPGESRIVLGMGTGWLETEHRQHGFPFEDVATRFRRLEEHLHAITSLWDPARDEVTLDGEFVSLESARFAPKPDPRPRIVVGGKGLRKTPDLAARFADELNGVFSSPEECRRQRAALDEACRSVGREPSSIAYSLMTGCLVGATEEEFRARAAQLHGRTGGGGDLDGWLEHLSGAWVLGTPERARERLAALSEAGVEAVMLQHQLHDDLDMLDVIAEHLM